MTWLRTNTFSKRVAMIKRTQPFPTLLNSSREQRNESDRNGHLFEKSKKQTLLINKCKHGWQMHKILIIFVLFCVFVTIIYCNLEMFNFTAMKISWDNNNEYYQSQLNLNNDDIACMFVYDNQNIEKNHEKLPMIEIYSKYLSPFCHLKFFIIGLVFSFFFLREFVCVCAEELRKELRNCAFFYFCFIFYFLFFFFLAKPCKR